MCDIIAFLHSSWRLTCICIRTPAAAAPKPPAHDDDSDYETPREHLPHDAYAPAQAVQTASIARGGGGGGGGGGGSLFHAQDLVGVRKGPDIPASAAAAAAGASQRPGSADVKSISKRPAPVVGSMAGGGKLHTKEMTRINNASASREHSEVGCFWGWLGLLERSASTELGSGFWFSPCADPTESSATRRANLSL